MHGNHRISAILLASQMLCFAASADTTIDTTNRSAYAANAGWLSAVADTNNGAIIGEHVCSGYVYSANCGWIKLGSGDPANGYRYSNSSGSDYGINHVGAGDLRGYAYSANCGWIKFEDQGDPSVDLLDGTLSGYVYGANIGWISLSNTEAHVQCASIDTGPDSDTDDIPDQWERSHTGSLGDLDTDQDADNDGATDSEEYTAGTDPFDADSQLIITDLEDMAATTVSLTWASTLYRLYRVQHTTNLLDTASWANALPTLVRPDGGASMSRNIGHATEDHRVFYRVQAVRPLTH